MNYKGITVQADDGIPSEDVIRLIDEEIDIWKQRGKKLDKVEITLDGDKIEVTSYERSPIKRLRRITGYIGTLDSFNDAKIAEARDRVSHT